MAQPVKLNLTIIQGSTFRQILRWESSTKVYVPITNITKSAPIVITAPSHGIPEGWRVKVTNVLGMKEINSNDIYHIATNTAQDSFEINNINSLNYTTYTSGGVVEYNQPVSINNFTARMQIRPKLKSDEIIHTCTTENGEILLNSTDNTITIYIPDEVTETFTFNSAVYSLELCSPVVDGESDTTQFVSGIIVLEKEVTR